jgi:hypothetical protein
MEMQYRPGRALRPSSSRRNGKTILSDPTETSIDSTSPSFRVHRQPNVLPGTKACGWQSKTIHESKMALFHRQLY